MKALKRLFGYISLTDDDNNTLWINIRAIMRYAPYSNFYLLHTKTRLWYLDGKSENIRETVEEIKDKISKTIL